MFLYLEKYRHSVVDNASPLRYHCKGALRHGVGGGLVGGCVRGSVRGLHVVGGRVGGGVVGASVGGFVGNSIRTMRLDTIRVHTH